jgi:hypothetical protein
MALGPAAGKTSKASTGQPAGGGLAGRDVRFLSDAPPDALPSRILRGATARKPGLHASGPFPPARPERGSENDAGPFTPVARCMG